KSAFSSLLISKVSCMVFAPLFPEQKTRYTQFVTFRGKRVTTFKRCVIIYVRLAVSVFPS
ncbi:hypothetical protein, partial [Bacillus thuringiensis]|uniref:hypothetical protein n=1 Tax=Bacillus thuringiensis TaxID=1428 RepID=UPI001C0D6727